RCKKECYHNINPHSRYSPQYWKPNSGVINLSAQCWHGCGEEGTLLHMLWHCPVIESLWREVAHFLSGILKVDLQLSPITCLLGARSVFTCFVGQHTAVAGLGK
uniref:Uncharacterized protein n=1 Tax=Dicentrarchus labrax TaxID=13489 RepID=A0A8C4I002_DICLA